MSGMISLIISFSPTAKTVLTTAAEIALTPYYICIRFFNIIAGEP